VPPPQEGLRRNNFPFCFSGLTLLVDRPCCASRPFFVVQAVFSPRSGTHQRRFQHQQPFEVKRQSLQEGCELILRHATVAHALRPVRKHPFVRSSQMRIPPVAIPVLRGVMLFRWIAAR